MLILIGPFLFFFTTLTSQAAVISPELQSVLPSLSDQDEISVIVTLSDRPNVHLIKDQDRRLRRSKIIRHLKEKADRSQRPPRTFLESRGAKGIKSLWLINGLAVTASAEVIRQLGVLPEVENIKLDATIHVSPVTYGATALPEWNLDAIGAPQLWSLGYTGQGTVIASMDTGVDVDHPDLKSKYRGGIQ